MDEGDNQAVWEEINLYRYFEMFIFYAQMFSIFKYIIVSKVIIYLKELTNTVDKKDPFQALITGNSDFLANGNIILHNYALLMDNIWALSFAEYMWLYAPTEEEEEDTFGPYRKEIGFVQLTIVCINFIWFLVMIWRGTGFRQFYSTNNLVVTGVIYGIFMAANLLTYFTTY